MATRKLQGGRRYGAAAVETAFVMIPVCLVFFGVFEYGRLLMDWNVLNNAAREGCRYALVNNTSPTISNDVQSLVTAKLGVESKSFSNFTVTVSGSHLGVSTPVANLVAGDLITVTASGKYIFINIPLIPTPALTITSAVTMVCEGVN